MNCFRRRERRVWSVHDQSATVLESAIGVLLPQNNFNLCVTNKLTKYLIYYHEMRRQWTLGGQGQKAKGGVRLVGSAGTVGTGMGSRPLAPERPVTLSASHHYRRLRHFRRCVSPHRCRGRSYDRLNCPCGLTQDSSHYRHNIGIRNDAALEPNPRPRPTKLYPPSYSPLCDPVPGLRSRSRSIFPIQMAGHRQIQRLGFGFGSWFQSPSLLSKFFMRITCIPPL